MKRRRIIIGLVVLPLVGMCTLAIWPRGPRPDRAMPCWATFERVREGMTRAEVCAAVGGTPADYSGGRRKPMCLGNSHSMMPRYHVLELWVADNAALWVEFDEDDRVAGLEVDGVVGVDAPIFSVRAATWLGL